jgi:hypothetical protein
LVAAAAAAVVEEEEEGEVVVGTILSCPTLLHLHGAVMAH